MCRCAAGVPAPAKRSPESCARAAPYRRVQAQPPAPAARSGPSPAASRAALAQTNGKNDQVSAFAGGGGLHDRQRRPVRFRISSAWISVPPFLNPFNVGHKLAADTTRTRKRDRGLTIGNEFQLFRPPRSAP